MKSTTPTQYFISQLVVPNENPTYYPNQNPIPRVRYEDMDKIPLKALAKDQKLHSIVSPMKRTPHTGSRKNGISDYTVSTWLHKLTYQKSSTRSRTKYIPYPNDYTPKHYIATSSDAGTHRAIPYYSPWTTLKFQGGTKNKPLHLKTLKIGDITQNLVIPNTVNITSIQFGDIYALLTFKDACRILQASFGTFHFSQDIQAKPFWNVIKITIQAIAPGCRIKIPTTLVGRIYIQDSDSEHRVEWINPCDYKI